MKVSVVMAARYRASSGPRCLKAVLTQSRPPDEIIMVNCGENEWAAHINSPLVAAGGHKVAFKYVRYHPASPTEYAYTRGVNKAWNRCTGDYVFITPTDALAPFHCIEASLAVQTGMHRVCHLVYGLDEGTTRRLDDPLFRWLGTDFEIFHTLSGFSTWWRRGWPPPNNSPLQLQWWGNTVFSSNTREGWEQYWPGQPFSDDTVTGNDEICLNMMEHGVDVPDRPISAPTWREITKCPVPVYHQWHLTQAEEDAAHARKRKA